LISGKDTTSPKGLIQVQARGFLGNKFSIEHEIGNVKMILDQ
jgi:hypothetical protein